MPVRLKDIARDLGVSVVTVSKVLRGNADIGEETRRRVLKRMKDLNYQPNMMARGLASGRTYAIGLVVPDLVHPFFAEFAKSLGGVLRASNRALILASSEEDPEIEQQEIRTLLSRGVDVLLIASCQANLATFYEPGDDRTPYLLFDRHFPHFVGSDDVKVGETATNHLVAIGRKRIAHIYWRQQYEPVFRSITRLPKGFGRERIAGRGELRHRARARRRVRRQDWIPGDAGVVKVGVKARCGVLL